MKSYIEMVDRLSSNVEVLIGIGHMLHEIMASITASADEGEAAKVEGYTTIIANEVNGIGERIAEVADDLLEYGRKSEP